MSQQPAPAIGAADVPSRPVGRQPGRRNRGAEAVGHWLLLGIAFALAIVFLFPFVWSILGSFKPPGEMLREPLTVLPSRISFENYRAIGSFGIGIWGYVGNTLFVTGLTIVGTVVLSTLAGYGFSRFDFRFKNVVFILVLATLMIPFQGILVPLFLLLNRFGLTNSLIGLSLIYITFQLPFGIFMMRNSFDTVPREIEEAALVDGASPTGALLRIMLPVALPGVATVVVFTFLASWNEFLAALIFLRESDKFTMPIMLNSVQAATFGIVDWGGLQAGVTITVIPAVVLFLALQRYYIRGLTQGAVKG
jgi:multiple sugar transport system permease protein